MARGNRVSQRDLSQLPLIIPATSTSISRARSSASSIYAASMAHFGSVGESEGLILVYPDRSGGSPGGRLLTWNAGDCCAYAMINNVDDVGFIDGVIDSLIASGRADPARIYVTGMSNGAMMTHLLAREPGSKIAAIAPVVGTIFGDEAPAEVPVPAFIIVGADDTVVPGAGAMMISNGIDVTSVILAH